MRIASDHIPITISRVNTPHHDFCCVFSVAYYSTMHIISCIAELPCNIRLLFSAIMVLLPTCFQVWSLILLPLWCNVHYYIILCL